MCQAECIFNAVQMSPWTESLWKQVDRTGRDAVIELSSYIEKYLSDGSISLIREKCLYCCKIDRIMP